MSSEIKPGNPSDLIRILTEVLSARGIEAIPGDAGEPTLTTFIYKDLNVASVGSDGVEYSVWPSGGRLTTYSTTTRGLNAAVRAITGHAMELLAAHERAAADRNAIGAHSRTFALMAEDAGLAFEASDGAIELGGERANVSLEVTPDGYELVVANRTPLTAQELSNVLEGLRSAGLLRESMRVTATPAERATSADSIQ